MIPAGALRGGFADPVFDAQSVFRGVLTALSRPGHIVDLAVSVAAPLPLVAGAAAIVAALADDTTPVYLDPALSHGAVPAWVGFHTGAPIVADPAAAIFAVLADPAEIPPFHAFQQGTAEYPDRSTTLIQQVQSLDGGGPGLVLAGPGIDGQARLAPGPLPNDFVARLRANRALFPCGIDLFLVAGSRIVGLPRSARVSEA